MPAPPWRDDPPPKKSRLAGEVEVIRARHIRAPAWAVRQVVQNIASIHLSERKADVVEVIPFDDRRGHYRVAGRMARLFRWTGEFDYVLSDAGFHSTGTGRGRGRSSIQVSGGFLVEDDGGNECRVVHYENYLLPPWAAAVKLVWCAYIARSMRAELRDVDLLARYQSLANGAVGAD